MEGYLHDEELEYLQDLYAYRDIVDYNDYWNQELGSHQVFNININNKNHVDNALVFITKMDNNKPKPYPCQAQSRRGWQ